MCGKIIIVVCLFFNVKYKSISLSYENGAYILFNILIHFWKCRGIWKAIIKMYDTRICIFH